VEESKKLGIAETMKGNIKMNTNFEEAIKNRLETGFKNWNSGYESWLE